MHQKLRSFPDEMNVNRKKLNRYFFLPESLQILHEEFARIHEKLFNSKIPVGIYLFKVNKGNVCEICSNLTVKTPERRQKWSDTLKQFIGNSWRIVWMYLTIFWRRSGVFIASFEQISHMAMVFSLLTLNK